MPVSTAVCVGLMMLIFGVTAVVSTENATNSALKTKASDVLDSVCISELQV